MKSHRTAIQVTHNKSVEAWPTSLSFGRWTVRQADEVLSGAVTRRHQVLPRIQAANTHLHDLEVGVAFERILRPLLPRFAQALFAERVYGVPDVEGIFSNIGADETVYIWTVIARDDFETRRQVYHIEADMYSQFPSIRFDFYVLAQDRLRKPIKDVVPSGFQRIGRSLLGEVVYAS